MAFTGYCPYLKETRKKNETLCECARFSFPDKKARQEVLYGYCGHPDNWKTCQFKKIMDGYYERKYQDERHRA